MPGTSKLLTEGEKKWLGELDAKYRDVDYTKLGGKIITSIMSPVTVVHMSGTHQIAINKKMKIAVESVIDSCTGKANLKEYIIN